MPHGATVSGFYTYEPFSIILPIFQGFLHNPKVFSSNSWISTIKRICQHCIFQEMQLVLVYLLFLKYLPSNSSLTYPQNRTNTTHIPNSISDTLFAATFRFCHQDFDNRSSAAPHTHWHKCHFQSHDKPSNSGEMNSRKTQRDGE